MKLRVNIPVIVEGKYDKARLSGVIDGCIIESGGFSVFSNDEKRALIRRLGSRGIIILSDSDGGGRIIRSRLKTILNGIKVYDLYVPQIRGKERRKDKPSAEGYLGVEGIDNGTLSRIFEKFSQVHPELFDKAGADLRMSGEAEKLECYGKSEKSGYTTESPFEKPVSAADLYGLGLTGGENSASLRDSVSVRIGLPRGMSSRGFLSAIEIIGVTADELSSIVEEIVGGGV